MRRDAKVGGSRATVPSPAVAIPGGFAAADAFAEDGMNLLAAGYSGSAWVMAQPSNPIDRIFRNGFDG